MVKKFLIALICVAAHGLFAQNGTISPYSSFGIGDLRNNSTIDNRMMAGISMHGDSIHINLQNPAAYSKLKLTSYTAAVSHSEFRLEDFTEEQNSSVTNLEYLAIGLPIAPKVGLGFGLMPFSSVGYNLESEAQNGDGQTVTNVFAGEGGLNRVYMSLGGEVIKNVSVGATVNFNFGRLDYQRIQSVEDVQFGTLEERESRINGFDINYALNYTPTIKNKYILYTSLLINTQANLTSENTSTLGSFSLVNGQEIEVIDVDLDASNLRNTELKIPTRFTVGLGFGESKKWFLGGEYSFQQFSEFSNDFLGLENVTYQDATKMAFGGYYIPDYKSLSSYFKRINYRAGVKYDVTGLVVNGSEINDFGITFGLGLPLPNSFSNVNLGFELGRRGTTVANLIRENYLNISVGLSLNAKWFQKRRID